MNHKKTRPRPVRDSARFILRKIQHDMDQIDRQKAALGKQQQDDMAELLQELRIVLQGAQLLLGFLITIPFSNRFALSDAGAKGLYLAAFMGAMLSLILFSAPAAQHRIERPVTDRRRFKQRATLQILGGLVFLSHALIFTTWMVLRAVAGAGVGVAATLAVSAAISLAWWLWPMWNKWRAWSAGHGNPGGAE